MTQSRIVDRFEQAADDQEHVAGHVVGDTDEQQQAMRAQLSGMWASVAGSWGEYAGYTRIIPTPAAPPSRRGCSS